MSGSVTLRDGNRNTLTEIQENNESDQRGRAHPWMKWPILLSHMPIFSAWVSEGGVSGAQLKGLDKKP